MILDFFKLAVHTLIHRKLRSLLTVLGIVIGITAVVALMSLGRGLQVAVNEQFSAVGTNLIIIQPGSAGFAPPTSGTGSAKLTERDVDIIKRINGVDNIFGLILNTGRLDFNSKTQFTYIEGLPDDPNDYGSLKSSFATVLGRDLKPGDKNKALIGYDLYTKDSIFGKTIRIGQKISIEGKVFDVVGVLKKQGNAIDDQAVAIPIDTARELFNNTDRFASLYIDVAENSNPDIIADIIKESLRKDRRQKEGEEDFKVQTSTELISSFNTVLNIIQAVIIGIAAISLLVGGIGIMNTMYTSVLERTKDIGILKSIGAKDSDILILFLIESGTIGLIGGIIGISIGIGIGKLVEFVAMQIFGSALIRAEFPIYLIVGALVFSFLVGSIAGLLPARQAAKKNPVDSLRYE